MISAKTNIEQLAADIGAYIGMMDGIDQRTYVQDLIHSAHDSTIPEFVKAAAKSAVRYNFTHMYEYGVAGITRGDKQFINPVLQSARLWTDVMVGSGSRGTITFVYRDAVRRVPKHTTEETGVAQEELDKLKLNQGKRYVFQHKAEVFEEGVDLNIHPKQKDGKLFVPLRGTSFKANERDQARGFTWAKKVHINPGEMSGAVGQFSWYFFNWWSKEGSVFITKNMDTMVTEHVKRAEAELGKSRGTLQSPASTNVTGAAKAAEARVRKMFTIWAREEADRKVVIV
jgi:hypothetical protein